MTASPDQLQAMSTAHGLLCLGARMGAAQVLFHAALQREATEVADLSQRPVFGRREAAPNPTAANDEHPITSDQPTPSVP